MALLRSGESIMVDSVSSDDAVVTSGNDEARDPEGATYRVRSHETVTEAVVRAVSSEAQSDSIDLPPLYPSVDPDALNRLFTHRGSGTKSARQPDGVVGFTHAEHHVRVNSDGTIDVAPPDRG